MSGHVVVLGAGVVGASAAAFLVRNGHKVTIVDRDPPGEGCSSGNAGLFGTASCVPSALPGILRRVPRMLLPDGPLNLDWRYLPTLAPWLVRFIRAGSVKRIDAISRAMNALQGPLLDAHLDLADWAKASELIADGGKIHVWFSETSWQRDAIMRDLLRSNGIPFQSISGDEAKHLAPALRKPPKHALWFEDIRHCTDPESLIQAYVAASMKAGARFVQTEVLEVVSDEDRGGWLVTDQDTISFDTLVVAAGVWSAAFARRLGDRVPLISQRGYHVMNADTGVYLPRPIKCEDRKIIVTTMDKGLRVTGIAELAPAGRPPSPSATKTLVAMAGTLLAGLPRDGWTGWMGARPCTPDSLPVIGRSKRSDSIVYAFGHGHWGFGLGAITGRLVAQIVGGQPTDIPLQPYLPERFLT